ncbi:hypothetical protein E2P81_ATG00197 [Venturia nashicola]|uniref:Secreted protein n=1 Tax=Venturia nashicola TaxID=86259 RepID=A0A4Z1PT07_9PEZI|nr:hypothetical protein E6O75_ATG00205 [Venturia nashicola]TLD39210.1 hypothetical protein E2P81_ATG00197 [Venturia nashicola]
MKIFYLDLVLAVLHFSTLTAGYECTDPPAVCRYGANPSTWVACPNYLSSCRRGVCPGSQASNGLPAKPARRNHHCCMVNPKDENAINGPNTIPVEFCIQ